MYAIVEISGKQYKITEGSVIKVDKIKDNNGGVNLDRVLLLVSENDIKVGSPVLENVKITAEIADKEVKGDKVVVFKWKRRKNYRRKQGHRQKYSRLIIKKIEESN